MNKSLITIQNCARCGQDHVKLPFQKMKTPAGHHTHFATCPVLSEPILMRIVDGPKEKSLKIYKTRIMYETVICATSPEEVLRNAEYIIRNDSDDPACEISCEELEDVNDLPDGWNQECIPWSIDVPHEFKIKEFFEKD